MRIRELSLRNYRPFVEYKQEFSDQFTVIAGVNGKGKTAILEALAMLMSRLLPQISPSKGGYRHLSLTDIYGNADETELMMQVNCAGIPLKFGGHYNRDIQIQTFGKLQRPLRRSILAAYGMDEMCAGGMPPIAAYYTTDRAGFRRPKGLPTRLPGGRRAAAYTGALLNRMVNYRDFMARMLVAVEIGTTEPATSENYFGERIVRTIQRAMTKFLPGFENLRVQRLPPRLTVVKDQVTLDLGQLSDGERSFLAMVCDLCRRLALANQDLPNPLDGEGVVLIDELELHLHPSWQREVVEKLRTTFPKMQFIVTTHSPFVIQSLRPGELVNLNPDEFSVEYADKSIEDITENVMGVELPQKSERYIKMMQAAEEYFKLLQNPDARQTGRIEETKQTLDQLIAPFSDDPAFQAFLKVEREASGLDR